MRRSGNVSGEMSEAHVHILRIMYFGAVEARLFGPIAVRDVGQTLASPRMETLNPPHPQRKRVGPAACRPYHQVATVAAERTSVDESKATRPPKPTSCSSGARLRVFGRINPTSRESPGGVGFTPTRRQTPVASPLEDYPRFVTFLTALLASACRPRVALRPHAENQGRFLKPRLPRGWPPPGIAVFSRLSATLRPARPNETDVLANRRAEGEAADGATSGLSAIRFITALAQRSTVFATPGMGRVALELPMASAVVFLALCQRYEIAHSMSPQYAARIDRLTGQLYRAARGPRRR